MPRRAMPRTSYSPYLVEQFEDDLFQACFPPDDLMEIEGVAWCGEELLDGEWGLEYDEFYSPLSSGLAFWFTNEDAMTLFLLTWRQL